MDYQHTVTYSGAGTLEGGEAIRLKREQEPKELQSEEDQTFENIQHANRQSKPFIFYSPAVPQICQWHCPLQRLCDVIK